MSLKRYLFLLVALLIIALTLVQLIFVSYIKEQLNNEIQDKSQALSEQVLDFVIDDLPLRQFQPSHRSETSRFEPNRSEANGPKNNGPRNNSSMAMTPEQIAQQYQVAVQPAPHQIIEINQDYSLVLGQQGRIVELTPRAPHQQTGSIQPQLRQLLDNIKITHSNDFRSITLVKQQDQSIEQKLFEFDQQDSVSDRYFSYLITIIIIMAILGLVIAYWLAHHISKPLAQLSTGFIALEQGKLGTNLAVSGITEMRNTLSRFNQMSNKLESLSQREQQFIKQQHIAELGEVTRGLAHALRNPINTIGLSLEQMAQPQTTDQQRQQLAIAARAKITAIDHTIKSLLTLAANENLTPQAVNINDIILDVMLELSMTSSQDIQFSNQETLIINGIESELRAIIHTVVVNATEANFEQQPIIIDVKQPASQLIITVTDSGCGIAASIYPDLFKPHITTKPEGAGMGLYIAKRLCQLHYRGDISLVNRDQQGCIATITLSTQQETPDEIN